MRSTKSEAGDAEGFQGDVAGLSLPDLVQLGVNNRFAGCVTVRNGDRVGRFFMRDGRIIHAEQGARTGEDAFQEIMAWRSGRFSLEPNVSTTSHTIQKSSQHLLMDAVRVVDERRAGSAAPPAAPGRAPQAAAPPRSGPAGALERLQGTEGVVDAVIMAPDGACVSGGGTARAEALAAHGAQLALVGERVGARLGLGKLRAAIARGPGDQVLLLAGKNGSLGLRVAGAADVAAVEARVRKLLEPGR